jgi:hypothetical protein
MFPRTAASARLIEQVDEFLAAQERDPGMVRLLVECRDVAERVIRSRALPGEGCHAALPSRRLPLLLANTPRKLDNVAVTVSCEA